MAFFRSIDVSRLPDMGEKPNQRVFHFPSEVMDTRKLVTELFSKNGSSDGGGFTMIVVQTKYFVICV